MGLRSVVSSQLQTGGASTGRRAGGLWRGTWGDQPSGASHNQTCSNITFSPWDTRHIQIWLLNSSKTNMNSQFSDGALRKKQMQKCKKWELFFFKPELNLCPGKPLCCIKAQRQCLEVGQQCFEWLWRRPKPLFVDLLYFGYGLNKDFSTKHLAQPPESHVVLSSGSLCLPCGWIW